MQVSQFDGLIDTGFTGFAQMPLAQALAVGLVTAGTLDLTFSDGSTQPMPVAWASIGLGSATREGFVILSNGSDDVLLGVHFLRLFQATFTYCVDSGLVELS